MIDEKTHHARPFSFSAGLEDWERLVKVSERSAIIELVKHDKHLQQHEFRGFRPDHLPWDRVPSLIARHAQGCDLTQSPLLQSWLTANKDLCSRVKAEVSIIAIEDNVAKLLAHIGSTEKNRDRLLWALILDGREEIKKALDEGLHDALLEESSYLWIKVEVYALRSKLEESERIIKGLQSERDGLKEQVAQVPKIVSTIQGLQQTIKQMETQHKMDLEKYANALRTAEEEREKIVEELEQARQEKDETQNLLNEVQKLLAEERKKRASVEHSESTLQSIRRVERERDLAYEKRDEERDRRQELETAMERLEKGKEAVIAQVRKKDRELKQVLGEKQQLEKELSKVQSELDAIHRYLNGQDLQVVLPFVKIDQAWDGAVEQVAHRVSLALSEAEATRQAVGANERWADWQSWQQMEEKLIRPLLSSLSIWAGIGDAQDVVRIENAQRLLLLRWYLLEWYKSLILDLLQIANRAVR